jgi:hypothetical protein
MKSWITNSEAILGVSEKQAEKFSREWYNIKRQETSVLWAQRQDIRKGEGISLTQLREKVAAAVKAKRARKAKTRTNEKYFKMSRKQLENFLEQERRITLGASITQFVVDVDTSDEERAKLKREKIIEKLNRSSTKRAAKRKQQRRRKLKRKLEAEQEVAHIDELLKSESGRRVKVGRKERHQITGKVRKAMKKAADSQRNAKKIESRNWEKTGKITMARWLSPSISNRDDRKIKAKCEKLNAWLRSFVRSFPHR